MPDEKQYGYMDYGSKFGFVFCNENQVIAHELGHGFSLKHNSNEKDTKNLMNEYSESTNVKLRYHQWRSIRTRD